MGKDRRRRAFLPTGIVILAVLGGLQYYLSNIFAPPDSGSTGTGGVPGAGVPTQTYQLPDLAVNALYKLVGTNDPQRACDSALSPQGGQAFAKDLGVSTCEQAVSQEAAKVTDPSAYRGTTVPVSAIHLQGDNAATISSCAIGVEGGDPLGTFLLTRQPNGWTITGHEPDPTPCPPPASN